MPIVHTVVYLFAGLFLVLALGLVLTYYRTRHAGSLIMAVAYAASAIAAIAYVHWAPLVAGFVIAWIFRFMGLDPEVPRAPRN